MVHEVGNGGQLRGLELESASSQRFLKEFMPEESVMEKISLLNSMTQEKNERVSDFKNKLTGKMEKFKSGMETMWGGGQIHRT